MNTYKSARISLAVGRLLVVCGTPCAGKTTLGQWLERNHDWLFINHDSRRGADESIEEAAWWRGVLSGSLQEFVSIVRSGERDIVVEFGFPIHLLPLVQQLREASGVQLWWFQGDRFLARDLFVKRNAAWIETGERPPIPIAAFDNTIAFQRGTWDRIRPLFRHRTIETLVPGRDRPNAESLFRTIASAAGWQPYGDSPRRGA